MADQDVISYDNSTLQYLAYIYIYIYINQMTNNCVTLIKSQSRLSEWLSQIVPLTIIFCFLVVIV